jgi:hypothetical protein
MFISPLPPPPPLANNFWKKKKIRARDYLKKIINNTAKNFEKKFVHVENGPPPSLF